jgi:hypothetical protein
VEDRVCVGAAAATIGPIIDDSAAKDGHKLNETSNKLSLFNSGPDPVPVGLVSSTTISLS